jgi:hypothetical protein
MRSFWQSTPRKHWWYTIKRVEHHKKYHNALTVANKAILEHMLSDDYDKDKLNLDEHAIY